MPVRIQFGPSGFRFGFSVAPFGEPVSPRIIILSEKEGSKNLFKKRRPSKVKRNPIPMSGGPWSGRLACAFLGQETIVRATFEALFEIIAKKSDLDSELLLFFDET